MSQPPSAVFGVPVISPFCARQSALPTVRAAPSEDPWKVQSGTKFLFAPARGSITHIAPMASDAQAICFHIILLLVSSLRQRKRHKHLLARGRTHAAWSHTGACR